MLVLGCDVLPCFAIAIFSKVIRSPTKSDVLVKFEQDTSNTEVRWSQSLNHDVDSAFGDCMLSPAKVAVSTVVLEHPEAPLGQTREECQEILIEAAKEVGLGVAVQISRWKMAEYRGVTPKTIKNL